MEEINALLYFPFLKFAQGTTVNTQFLYMDLSKPDPYFILAVLSGAVQFLASKMTMPFSAMGEKVAKKTPEKTDDIAYNMQKQMLYTMPIMNVIVGVTLPSGVVLYILTAAVFSVLQSYLLHGFGGLTPDLKKIKKWIKK